MRSLLLDQWQKERTESARSLINPLLYTGWVWRLWSLVVRWLRARWTLRPAHKVGGLVMAKGSLLLQHFGGRLEVGTHVRIWSDIQQTQLVVGPEAKLQIDDGCFLNGATVAAYQSISIGKGVYLAPMCHVTDSHAFGWPDAADPAQTAPVVLEDKAWIATRAIIMPGVTVGEGAVVGVGAVVSEDVPPYTVVGGVPARIIRTIEKTEE